MPTAPSKVTPAAFAAGWTPGASLAAFLERLPDILAAADLKTAIAAIVAAHQNHRPVIFGMGAHVIKVGLGPVVVDLMERGVITGVAMNGAGIIHDAELAMIGRTSEDVGPALDDGSFGMAEETSAVIAGALEAAVVDETGLGRAVGAMLLASGFPFTEQSILAAGTRLGIPVTVHVAIGTDIIHMHPAFDAARTGAASHVDFRILAAQVAHLEAGVYINAGSAVVLPEVFLKAVSLARNLGHRLERVHDRQFGLRPPLPADGQRRSAPHGPRREGHQPGRPPRNHAPAHRRRGDRGNQRSPKLKARSARQPIIPFHFPSPLYRWLSRPGRY